MAVHQAHAGRWNITTWYWERAWRQAHLAGRQLKAKCAHVLHRGGHRAVVHEDALAHEHNVVKEVERLGRGLQQRDEDRLRQLVRHGAQPPDDSEERRCILHGACDAHLCGRK